MKTPRCTKCKWFRKSKAKIKIYDHGKGMSMTCTCLVEGLANYYCKNRWWNFPSLKYFRENDVCEDFEFKTKELWQYTY